jgi:NAD(P)-dependent dehydrogenase (short-subunit alcohol dehydrogenase family)
VLRDLVDDSELDALSEIEGATSNRRIAQARGAGEVHSYELVYGVPHAHFINASFAYGAIRHEFDVNVFGALSVMNAFLPALRKALGRIVQVSTWTASVPLPFNGPSGASKAAMEVFATVYRAGLKRFGIDVVVAAAGKMKTGGPEKTAAALKRVADGMTPEQRELYGQTFGSFAAALNGMQSSGLDSAAAAARRVIELAEQVPALSRAPVGADAEEMLRVVREKSDAEQDALRLQLVGLS